MKTIIKTTISLIFLMAINSKAFAQSHFKLDKKVVDDYTAFIKKNNIEQEGNEILTIFKEIADNLNKSYNLLQQKDTTEAFIIYKQQRYPHHLEKTKVLKNYKEFRPHYKALLALTREKAKQKLKPSFSKFGDTGTFYFEDLAKNAMENKDYNKALKYINLQLRILKNYTDLFESTYYEKAEILSNLNKDDEALKVLDEAENRFELSPKKISNKDFRNLVFRKKMDILLKLASLAKTSTLEEYQKISDDNITAIKENSLPKTKDIEIATIILKRIEAVKVIDCELQKYKDKALKKAWEAKAIAIAVKAKAIAIAVKAKVLGENLKIETDKGNFNNLEIRYDEIINELANEAVLLAKKVDENANENNSLAIAIATNTKSNVAYVKEVLKSKTLDALDIWIKKWNKDLYNPLGKKELKETLNIYDNVYGNGSFMKNSKLDNEIKDMIKGILNK